MKNDKSLYIEELLKKQLKILRKKWIEKPSETSKVYFTILQNPGIPSYQVGKKILGNKRKITSSDITKFSGYVYLLKKHGLVTQELLRTKKKTYQNYAVIEPWIYYLIAKYVEGKEDYDGFCEFILNNQSDLFKEEVTKKLGIVGSLDFNKADVLIQRLVALYFNTREYEHYSNFNLNLDGIRELRHLGFDVLSDKEFLNRYFDSIPFGILEFHLILSKLRTKCIEHLKKLKEDENLEELHRFNELMEQSGILSSTFIPDEDEKELIKIIEKLKKLEDLDIKEAIEKLKEMNRGYES